jgi:hypothetical protein
LRRLILAASLTLAVVVVLTGANTHASPRPVFHVAADIATKRQVPIRHGHRCTWHHGKPVLFRIKHAANAARAAWSGTRTPTPHDWQVLLLIARCQQNPHASKFVHEMYHGFAAANAHRRYEAAHPFVQGGGVASWYDDGGSTASGFHSYYGFATCGSSGPCLSFGTRVEFCYPTDGNGQPVSGARCVTGVADDHGPYVGGRNFDVNQNIEGVLGFDGVGTVAWRIV